MYIPALANLKTRFENKAFRDSFIAEQIGTKLAFQIRKLREDRGWSQADLAERAGMKQSRISELEDPNYAKYTISTLRRLASAFDVALDVRFESYGEALELAARIDSSKLEVASFASDPFFGDASQQTMFVPTLSANYAGIFGRGQSAPSPNRCFHFHTSGLRAPTVRGYYAFFGGEKLAVAPSASPVEGVLQHVFDNNALGWGTIPCASEIATSTPALNQPSSDLPEKIYA